MSYFTIKRSLFLVPTLSMMEEYKKIDKFMLLLEKSGVAKILKNVNNFDGKCKGPNGYNPYNLFAAIVYCFATSKASLRNIEDRCTYDTRVLYIMEGNVPAFNTIGNYINEYILPYQYEIFTLINKQIIKELQLDISNVYNDGTKIEANANKYKFIWKPKKFHQNLDKKIKEFIVNIGYTIDEKEYIKSSQFYTILVDYVTKNNIDINNIPSGRGCRRTEEQRNYKDAYQYLVKLIEYEEKEEICGPNRNSYYKTDHDATAMALKVDYYSGHGSNMHAAYNVQVLVSSLLILMYGVFQDRTDYHTFISMNDNFFKYYGFYPKNECADSGYGIYDNYLYMKENNIGNYVKFLSWNGETSGKNPQIFKVNKNREIICLNEVKGKLYQTNTHPKIRDGKFYKFDGCNSCDYSYKCRKFMKEENKNKNYRIKEISIEYELLKQEARENLLSPKGIEIRVNRSIQVEGTFGQIKQNMNYNRIRRRGLERVSCEIMLECLGANIRRFLNIDEENKFKENCWNTPSDLQSEVLPKCKPKKRD